MNWVTKNMSLAALAKTTKNVFSMLKKNQYLVIRVTKKEEGNLFLMSEHLFNLLAKAHKEAMQEKPVVTIGFTTEEIDTDPDGHTRYSAPIPRREIPKEDTDFSTDENDERRWTHAG